MERYFRIETDQITSLGEFNSFEDACETCCEMNFDPICEIFPTWELYSETAARNLKRILEIAVNS